MYEQVRLYDRRCNVWSGVKASFLPRDAVLLPLPIMGMFYRRSVDLAGPFPQSEYGNYYIMVMIEHFSNWDKVEAIHTKKSCESASVFRQYVLCRYRAGRQLRC